MFIDGINMMIDAANSIPGVNLEKKGKVTWADDYSSKMQNDINRRNQEMADKSAEIMNTRNEIADLVSEKNSKMQEGANNIINKAIEMNDTRDQRVADRNNWIKDAGAAVNNALDSFSLDPSSFENGTLGDIAGNTKNIADNTTEISDEDLKYLIDIAERDTVNRFTTVPLSIEINNNNNINSEEDIDGIVDKVTDKLTAKLEEELEYVSDGIHE